MLLSAQEWIHVRVDAPSPRGTRSGLVTSAKRIVSKGSVVFMLTVCYDDGGMGYAFSNAVTILDEPRKLPHWRDHGLSEYCRARHENGNLSWWAICVCGYQTPRFSTQEGARALYEAHYKAISDSRDPGYQKALRGKRNRRRY